MIFIITYFTEKTPGRSSFLFLMGMAMIWTFGYAMELAVTSNGEKLFWLNFQQIGIYLAPFAWFFLSLEHLKSSKLLNKKIIVPLLVIPIFHIFLNFTNDYHKLLRKEIYYNVVNSVVRIETDTSIIFWVFIAFYYTLLVFSLINFLLAFLKRKGIYKFQSFILMMSLIIPYSFNVIDLIGKNPFYPYSPTALTFIPSGILIMYALFKYNLFRITPIAHEKIIRNMEIGVVVTNEKLNILDYNPFMKHEFYYKEKYIGKRLRDIDPLLYKQLKMFINNPEDQHLEFQKNEDMSKYYKMKITPLNDDKGYIIIIYDITNQKVLEKELMFKATKDFLTKTSNRYEFFGEAEKLFEIAKHNNKDLSVIMIDIDNFKRINDNFGHSTGDFILESFANLCREIIPENSIFGRLGGEEFAIVIPEYNIEEIRKISEIIKNKTYSSTNIFLGHNIKYTASIGISTVTTETKTFDQILKKSDDALYKAKRLGKNRVSI